MLRKIIHIDMDAFFTSVEQRDDPSLRGRPVAVAERGTRSVISAASYEARQWGVRSAQPMSQALRKCPNLVIVPPRYDVYEAVSKHVHRIFSEHTDLIEPLYLDEAFLDVTVNKLQFSLARDIAVHIKTRIQKELSLTASAGVSYNKFLAKVASEYRKPNGLCVIHPEQAQRFVDTLPIEAFWGVGRVTAERMRALNIHTGADLRAISLERLTTLFGRMGAYYYDFSHGIDHRPVVAERDSKSVGCERTFEQDLTTTTEMKIVLLELATELEHRLLKADFHGRTLTLKVKLHDFQTLSRRQTYNYFPRTANMLHQVACQLLTNLSLHNQSVRLLGLSLSHPLSTPTIQQDIQLSLFPEEEWQSLIPTVPFYTGVDFH